MGGTISLADLKAQMTPRTIKPENLNEKLANLKVPTKSSKLEDSIDTKPADETHGPIAKKPISLEQLKKQIEGINVKPEKLNEHLTPLII
jgi:hypothetical protein